MRVANRRKSKQPAIIGQKPDRLAFWSYCTRTINNAKERARERDLPFAIDVHFLDRMLVDQGWCCAVSGIRLSDPGRAATDFRGRDPFAPSLDRIVPKLGYVPGNVRVVCNMANYAMNEWGQDALLKLIDAMRNR